MDCTGLIEQKYSPENPSPSWLSHNEEFFITTSSSFLNNNIQEHKLTSECYEEKFCSQQFSGNGWTGKYRNKYWIDLAWLWTIIKWISILSCCLSQGNREKRLTTKRTWELQIQVGTSLIKKERKKELDPPQKI